MIKQIIVIFSGYTKMRLPNLVEHDTLHEVADPSSSSPPSSPSLSPPSSMMKNYCPPGVSTEHVLDPIAEHQMPPGHPALPLLPLLSGMLLIIIILMIVMTIIMTTMMKMMTTMQVCLERPIYPCRSLCLGVRQGCQGRMEAYGFPWSVFGYFGILGTLS